MTFSEEYTRMRPLEDNDRLPTVWANTSRKPFDQERYCFQHLLKILRIKEREAQHLQRRRPNYFLNPSPLLAPYPYPPKPKVTWYWDNWVSEDGELHVEKAWTNKP